MTSGGQCVMTTGIVLMQQLSASNWDMQPLEVSACTNTLLTFTKFTSLLSRWSCI